MFDSASLPHRVDAETYRNEVKALRVALLEAQFELVKRAEFPVLLLVSGHDAAGKSETIHQLYEWFDPRYLTTWSFSEPSEHERRYPPMWRYWQALPPKGRIGIFAGSWYSQPIADQVAKRSSLAELDREIERINRFEQMLANEGALLVKFWFHLTQDGQKRRLKALAKDPSTAWRVTAWHWKRLKTYPQLFEVANHVLRLTDTPWAAWQVINGEDDRYRHLMAGKILLTLLRERLTRPVQVLLPSSLPKVPSVDGRDVISALDLTQKVSRQEYDERLPTLQGELSALVRHKRFAMRSLVVVFEGVDAAGKGGTIKRVAWALDPRQFRIVPVAAPTDEEQAQPYLWRFWRHIPAHGRITIFDRSWYGRVLVERVEGFCQESDWQRAYAEINDFEHELVEAGVILVKFWLQISYEEQLRRFRDREATPHKSHKITDEDWRNREKWPLYHQAVCDMIDRTSTGQVPWTLIEAEDKRFARLKVLKTLVARLKAALDLR